MPELLNRPGEIATEVELLVGRIRDWVSVFQAADFQEQVLYVQDVNRRYDALANIASAEDLVELRLMRSLWAKKSAQHIVHSLPTANRIQLETACSLLGFLRTQLRVDAVKRLLQTQKKVGDASSGNALSWLLAEHAESDAARLGLQELNASSDLFRRLGPERILKFRPSRKSGNYDPTKWLLQKGMSKLDFVDGDPDRIRIRGIELHSGDIGIVELNHPGDGLLECFLERPGLAPHAMLYVTRRIRVPKTGELLFQPSVIEIYEGGWRSVPITTALHPEFSWYSEWVRPTIDGKELGRNLGEVLSTAIDSMEVFAFDFQARRTPTGANYSFEFGGSCASCTNLIRVPFERAGIHNLPYPITKLVPNAARNLAILGMPEMLGIHTPTNILNDSGFRKIGVVDNGCPELGYAQALVVGRPELPDTFGGWMSNKELNLENLPNWRSVKNWKSAWESLRIRIGQSESTVGHVLRKMMGVDENEVPKSASDTMIAFYIRSDIEAKHIINRLVYPAVSALLRDSNEIMLLSELRADSRMTELVRLGILDSALRKENWYREL